MPNSTEVLIVFSVGKASKAVGTVIHGFWIVTFQIVVLNSYVPVSNLTLSNKEYVERSDKLFEVIEY